MCHLRSPLPTPPVLHHLHPRSNLNEVTNNNNDNNYIDKTTAPVESTHPIYLSNFDMPVQQLIHQQKMQELEDKSRKLRMENDQLVENIMHKFDQ